jgi:hypothetical protein
VEPTDALFNVVEASLALAGFAGIVTALGQRSTGNWRLDDRHRIVNLLLATLLPSHSRQARRLTGDHRKTTSPPRARGESKMSKTSTAFRQSSGTMLVPSTGCRHIESSHCRSGIC